MSAKNASSIQVCIKVRPCEPGLTSLWQVKEGRSIHLADSHAEPYVFDYVFDEGASNQDVFDRMARHIVHACMQGFNGTIFAYGQTSSGKTYTMMGDEQNPGVMVLAAKEISNRSPMRRSGTSAARGVHRDLQREDLRSAKQEESGPQDPRVRQRDCECELRGVHHNQRG
ncbi:GM11098 [Drosophila sechellia]|uniref:GM11098 n=1 Tax=Drosophila sechellia TaxID=7238 RepID=B4HX34_DROSE|nr:GM11098 [Drosophila sechellia]